MTVAPCTCQTQHPDDPTPCPRCDSIEVQVWREEGPDFGFSVDTEQELNDRLTEVHQMHSDVERIVIEYPNGETEER